MNQPSRQMTWFQTWAWIGNDADKVQLHEFVNGLKLNDSQPKGARMDD
jgi:hypothetical protein